MNAFKNGDEIAGTAAIMDICAREALDNRAEPRDNASVIAGGDWVHGRQAARIR